MSNQLAIKLPKNEERRVGIICCVRPELVRGLRNIGTEKLYTYVGSRISALSFRSPARVSLAALLGGILKWRQNTGKIAIGSGTLSFQNIVKILLFQVAYFGQKLC
jgi:hypothetical protein